MEVECLKETLLALVCSEWQTRTASISRYNQERKLGYSFMVKDKLDGYLSAMAAIALLIGDEELSEDLRCLILTLIYFDSSTPLSKLSEARSCLKI